MRQRREGVFGDGRRIGIGFFLIYCWYAKIGRIISPKAHPFGPHSIGMEVKADVFELMFSEGGWLCHFPFPLPRRRPFSSLGAPLIILRLLHLPMAWRFI